MKKTIRFFIIINRLKKKAKKIQYENTPLKQTSANEFAEAERTAIKLMQANSFEEEINLLKAGKRVKASSKYYQDNLYLDKYQIIRTHGRLSDTSFEKVNTPILFEYKHPLTLLYIQYKHKCYNNSSIVYTLNLIRRDIHSIKLRKQITEVIEKCIICKKLLGRPYKYPENPPLDVYRTKCEQPFSTSGCDLIGPFTVVNDLEEESDKENTRKEKYKIWIVLFTCLVTRMSYLTLIPNRNTEAFLMALRELSARHTEPKLIISDNEGAFHSGYRILQEIALRPAIKNILIKQGIIWKFLPSRASWMGAIWERLVGIVKKELWKMQMGKLFNEYEWRVHLAEIEAVINERPLTYVSDKGTEPEVITPKALFNGCLTEATLGIDKNIEEIYLDLKKYKGQTVELYKEKIRMKEKFWENLKENYLTSLRTAKYKPDRSKKQYCKKEPKVGDVIVIHEEDMRLKWKLGIIHELIPSSDGEIRKAIIKTTLANKNIPLKRTFKTILRIKAISHLYPLELNIENNLIGFEVNQEQLEQDEQNTSLDEINNIINSEEIEACEAQKCIRPTELILKWIQCHSCKAWFHTKCLNMRNDINFDDIFFACLKCWQPTTPTLIEDETENFDFEGFTEDEMKRDFPSDLDNNIGKRVRQTAQKCREKIIQKIKERQI